MTPLGESRASRCCSPSCDSSRTRSAGSIREEIETRTGRAAPARARRSISHLDPAWRARATCAKSAARWRGRTWRPAEARLPGDERGYGGGQGRARGTQTHAAGTRVGASRIDGFGSHEEHARIARANAAARCGVLPVHPAEALALSTSATPWNHGVRLQGPGRIPSATACQDLALRRTASRGEPGSLGRRDAHAGVSPSASTPCYCTCVVAERRREFGLRMALCASARRVSRWCRSPGAVAVADRLRAGRRCGARRRAPPQLIPLRRVAVRSGRVRDGHCRRRGGGSGVGLAARASRRAGRSIYGPAAVVGGNPRRRPLVITETGRRHRHEGHKDHQDHKATLWSF